jgi:hypothetical protein
MAPDDPEDALKFLSVCVLFASLAGYRFPLNSSMYSLLEDFAVQLKKMFFSILGFNCFKLLNGAGSTTFSLS